MARSVQLNVALENKPGQLAKLTSALSRAKVNIEAISVVDTETFSLVRLIASSNNAAKQALGKAGMTVLQNPVITLKVQDQPGALAAIAKKLGDAKVNIEYVYGSAAGAGKQSVLVLSVSDIEKATAALGDM